MAFTIPTYVRTKHADAEDSTPDNPSGIRIDSQENVWLSNLKLACGEFLPYVRQSYARTIMDAAKRYRIEDDLKSASAFIEKLDTAPKQIRTEFDWKQSKDWLEKNAQYLDLNTREGIVDHLFTKAAEINYTLSLSEDCLLRQLAGRDPITPELEKVAAANTHKLASGKYYTTDQFAALSFEEVREFLPELMKKASFELPVLHAGLFAEAARSADVHSAEVLDVLLRKHGQMPVYDESDPAVEINDAMLARL